MLGLGPLLTLEYRQRESKEKRSFAIDAKQSRGVPKEIWECEGWPLVRRRPGEIFHRDKFNREWKRCLHLEVKKQEEEGERGEGC